MTWSTIDLSSPGEHRWIRVKVRRSRTGTEEKRGAGGKLLLFTTGLVCFGAGVAAEHYLQLVQRVVASGPGIAAVFKLLIP